MQTRNLMRKKQTTKERIPGRIEEVPTDKGSQTAVAEIVLEVENVEEAQTDRKAKTQRELTTQERSLIQTKS